MPCALKSRRMTRVSSAAITAASRRTSSARKVMSRRFPIGVGTMITAISVAGAGRAKAHGRTKCPVASFSKEIVLEGHIIDSGLFGRVLELLTDNEHARYRIDDFVIGQAVDNPSTARLTIEAETPSELDELIEQ